MYIILIGHTCKTETATNKNWDSQLIDLPSHVPNNTGDLMKKLAFHQGVWFSSPFQKENNLGNLFASKTFVFLTYLVAHQFKNWAFISTKGGGDWGEGIFMTQGKLMGKTFSGLHNHYCTVQNIFNKQSINVAFHVKKLNKTL